MNHIKKTIVCILWLTSLTTHAAATTEPLYLAFYFNLHSISKSVTDKQCDDLFRMPRQYTIVNDKVIYKDNANYIISDYQRTNVTYLNKIQYLFTGTSTISFPLNGKTHSTKEDVAFVLTIPDQKIQGSFIIDGYCKGNMIGVKQNNNQWPPV